MLKLQKNKDMSTNNDKLVCGSYLDIHYYYTVSLNVGVKFYIFVIQLLLNLLVYSLYIVRQGIYIKYI